MELTERQKTIRELQCKLADEVVRREEDLYAIECGFDPKECQEMHLPGDCPLCGGA